MNALLRFVEERPGLSAALLFLGLSLVFFAAVLLPPAGQVLAGHDMIGNYEIFWDVVRDALRSG